MFEDVVRDQRFVNALVAVGFEMDELVLGEAFIGFAAVI